MRVSHYLPLVAYLAASEGESVRLSFVEIETILGAPLSVSAQVAPSYWTNTHNLRCLRDLRARLGGVFGYPGACRGVSASLLTLCRVALLRAGDMSNERSGARMSRARTAPGRGIPGAVRKGNRMVVSLRLSPWRSVSCWDGTAWIEHTIADKDELASMFIHQSDDRIVRKAWHRFPK
jgi:hypothetical protein